MVVALVALVSVVVLPVTVDGRKDGGRTESLPEVVAPVEVAGPSATAPLAAVSECVGLQGDTAYTGNCENRETVSCTGELLRSGLPSEVTAYQILGGCPDTRAELRGTGCVLASQSMEFAGTIPENYGDGNIREGHPILAVGLQWNHVLADNEHGFVELYSANVPVVTATFECPAGLTVDVVITFEVLRPSLDLQTICVRDATYDQATGTYTLHSVALEPGVQPNPGDCAGPEAHPEWGVCEVVHAPWTMYPGGGPTGIQVEVGESVTVPSPSATVGYLFAAWNCSEVGYVTRLAR